MTLADLSPIPGRAALPILPAFIAEHLAPDRAIALAERRDGQTVALSAAEVQRQAAAVAHALRARGVGTGDRVAILANNSMEWLVADFGILYAGAVVVPMFATTADDQIAFILADSAAKLVFVDDSAAAEHVGGVVSGVPLVALRGDGAGSFAQLVREGEALAGDDARLAAYHDGIGLDDLAVLIYTSGTTGQPKGVMLSHGNLVSDVTSAFEPADSAIHEGEIGLSVLPFAHIYEHMDALGYLYSRLAHYVTTPERLIDDMRAIRPMYVAFVPRIFERLIAAIIGNARAAGGLKAKL
ncbi:MAG: fadD15, partial [Candidatus Eremiobacteraeota bacterium]|nr:fadD15 [Candidatus Eremiobacteraeota bacterium]